MESINEKCSPCSSDMATGICCQTGHNICHNCIGSELEKAIDEIGALVLKFIERRIKSMQESEEHPCEGAQFCKWKCKWKGDRDQIFEHFQHSHERNVLVQSPSFLKTKININQSSSTLNLIRLNINGVGKLFWYKQKIDLQKKVVYLIIQHIGLKKEANRYFYEFTAVNNSSDVLKIRQMCESSEENVNNIIDEGRCGIIPFHVISNYLDDMEIAFICKIDLIKLEIQSATCTNNVSRSRTKSYVTEPSTYIKRILIRELEDNNQDIVDFEATIRMVYNFSGDYSSYHILYTGKKETEKKFMFKCANNVHAKSARFLIQYFEEENIANNYFYEIIVSSDPLSAFKVQKKCRSIYENETKIVIENECVTIPFNVMESCLNNTNEFTFIVTIKEENCSKNPLDMSTNLPSYANIMEECLEVQSKKIEYPYVFVVPRNDNFPKSNLESDPITTLNVAENRPKLFNPVFFNFTDKSGDSGVDLTIFTKTTINFERSSSHEGIFAHVTNPKEACFFVKIYHDTKTRMVHWMVEYNGTERLAKKFFYELSIYYKPANFFKVRKICRSNVKDDKYIEEGKCVSLPFDSIKNFMNQKNEIFCIVRIQNMSTLSMLGLF